MVCLSSFSSYIYTGHADYLLEGKFRECLWGHHYVCVLFTILAFLNDLHLNETDISLMTPVMEGKNEIIHL